MSRFLLLLLALLSVGCWQKDGSVNAVFVSQNNETSPEFFLELADTPEKQALGLMYRKSLRPDSGMLFIFPDSNVRTFWMKNTYLSLDMLFLDEDLRIVGILHSVPPLNEQPRSVNVPSKHVIELPAGTAKRQGIEVGAHAQLSVK